MDLGRASWYDENVVVGRKAGVMLLPAAWCAKRPSLDGGGERAEDSRRGRARPTTSLISPETLAWVHQAHVAEQARPGGTEARSGCIIFLVTRGDPKAKPCGLWLEAAAVSGRQSRVFALSLGREEGAASMTGMAQTEPSEMLQDLVWLFEETGRKAYEAKLGNPMSGEAWTCDGGAVMLAHLAERMMLEHKLCVGLYWHESAENLAKTTGEDLEYILENRNVGDGELALDEHHHWIEVEDPETRELWIVDPNGEGRGEPRLQPAGGTERYQADDKQGYWSGIDSKTDPLDAMVPKKNWRTVLKIAQALAGQRGIDLVSMEALKDTRQEAHQELE